LKPRWTIVSLEEALLAGGKGGVELVHRDGDAMQQHQAGGEGRAEVDADLDNVGPDHGGDAAPEGVEDAEDGEGEDGEEDVVGAGIAEKDEGGWEGADEEACAAGEDRVRPCR